jgi:hypothetical protein
MVFKQRRANQSEPRGAGKSASQFRHSSGATDLQGLLGAHTLDDEAEGVAPKGYRARSTAKTSTRR